MGIRRESDWSRVILMVLSVVASGALCGCNTEGDCNAAKDKASAAAFNENTALFNLNQARQRAEDAKRPDCVPSN
ncbi:MAG TPA: hypothetical protein V6C72_07840 [Chroococcales cyanobacterium]